jgi:hypothetical protein
MPGFSRRPSKGLASPGIAAWLRCPGDPVSLTQTRMWSVALRVPGTSAGGSFTCEADAGVADQLEEQRLPVGAVEVTRPRGLTVSDPVVWPLRTGAAGIRAPTVVSLVNRPRGLEAARAVCNSRTRRRRYLPPMLCTHRGRARR